MVGFMHKLAEGLRVREQYLEDHSDHPLFETEADEDGTFKTKYDELIAEWREFTERVNEMMASGEDYDEHFQRKIQDEQKKLSLKVDAWKKKLEDK